jgi:hypothetical protein
VKLYFDVHYVPKAGDKLPTEEAAKKVFAAMLDNLERCLRPGKRE